jgi:ATP-dependent DNA helicase RecQ
MLWQKQDAGLLGFFANQITDKAERDRAWQRYHTIRQFVDSHDCRHHQICTHFGETPKWTACGACDVCNNTPPWLAQTFLPDPRKRRTFGVGESGKRTGAVPGAAGAGSYVPGVSRIPQIETPVSAEEAALREFLREWRRAEAKERGAAAFVVMHDSTLDEIARRRPATVGELLNITGIGERKAEMYGPRLLDALGRFRNGERASAVPAKKTAPAIETLRLLAEGKTFEEIAQIRERQIATVVNGVASLVEQGHLEFRPEWVDRNRLPIIEAACAQHGTERLKNLKDALPPEITYEEIRLVVARLRREKSRKPADIPA